MISSLPFNAADPTVSSTRKFTSNSLASMPSLSPRPQLSLFQAASGE